MISALTIMSSARRMRLPRKSVLVPSPASRLRRKVSWNSSITLAANRGFATKLSTPAVVASSMTSSQLYEVRMMMTES